MKSKHAYLIMAHEQFGLLCKLIRDLDDERNDIFLHIDSKICKVPFDEIKRSVKKSNLYLVERMKVNWGGYTQIKCELHLLEKAVNTGHHSYYHFLCGTEFPLKNQDDIHEFFDSNQGMEYLEYDMKNEFMKRVKYYHFFNECGRPSPRNGIPFLKNMFRQWMIKVQKCMGIDITRKYDITFMKGNANWSITEELAYYVLERKMEIKKMYAHSYCADEVYLHTLVYNSFFFQRVYKENGKTSNKRKQQWDRIDNCYDENDVSYLIESSALFARKFSGIEGKKAIEKICELRNNKRNEDRKG